MRTRQFFGAFVLFAMFSAAAMGQQIIAPAPQPASVSGTVIDADGDIVPGATVVLEGPVIAENRTVVAKDDGSFTFAGIAPGSPYHVTIRAEGFVPWTSASIPLSPGQYFILTGDKLAKPIP